MKICLVSQEDCNKIYDDASTIAIANGLPVYNLDIIEPKLDGVFYTNNERLARHYDWDKLIVTESYQKEKLVFQKVRDVKTPSYGSDGAAGIDFYIPNYTEYSVEFAADEHTVCWYSTDVTGDSIHFPARSLVRIPTGLKVKLPKGKALICKDKSSRGIHGLLVTCGVIDCDYQGEMSMCVLNLTDKDMSILCGQKLIQMIVVDTPQYAIECVDSSVDIFSEATARGERGFGTGSNN